MSVYNHIRQLVVQESFLTRSDFPRKGQKLILFCFYRVTKTHQDKIAPLIQVSVCGRVVKPSGLNTALSSCNRISIGYVSDGARFTHHFISVNLNESIVSQRFVVDCYISLYHIILLPLLIDLGFAWKILLFINYFCLIFSIRSWAKILEEFQSKIKSNKVSHIK